MQFVIYVYRFYVLWVDRIVETQAGGGKRGLHQVCVCVCVRARARARVCCVCVCVV